MDTAGYFDEAFSRTRVMAILRNTDPSTTVDLCHRAWAAGVEVVEVAVQSPEALPSLEAAVAAGREQGRQVGAGTVTTPEQVLEVHRAGAGYAVAPGMDAVTATAASDVGLPYLPGVSSATDIQVATRCGLTWLKAFPASLLTPSWLTAQLAPFPRARFVATGGVDARNAPGFLAAGARAVGVGSAISDPAQIALLAEL